MVDVALIVIAAIVPFVLTLFNVIVMSRYLDLQATSGHYFAKLMILLGMLLCEATILLLPLDVGNRSGVIGCGFWNNDCGGLNLTVVWEIAFCIIFGLLVVVFPFFIFFYEADDEGLGLENKVRKDEEGNVIPEPEGFLAKLLDFRSCKRSLCSAIVYTLITIVISVVVLVVMYSFLAQAQIPYRATSVTVDSVAFLPAGTTIGVACAEGACIQPCGTGTCNWTNSILTIDVTFIIYLAALMSFVGWFIFSIYVGIGFIALPIDCFNAFRYRPKVMSSSELTAARKALRTRASELERLGNDMFKEQRTFHDAVHSRSERRKHSRNATQELNRYRVLVDMLEQDLEKFQLGDPAYYAAHFNPLWPYAKLVFGVISVVLTLAWIIHIIIYMLFDPPLYAFLNVYFTWFDKWFPLFGTISVAIFGMYLLLAAAKGNTKFGTRFFLIKVHPMERGKTLMNAFVFNVGLILLCVLPVTQFCTDAFSQYARLTDASVIFSSQFKYLKFFTYFYRYNVFLFMILIFTLLSLIYFSLCPSDRAHLNNVMNQIKVKNKQQLNAVTKKIDQQGGSMSAVELKKMGVKK